MATFAHSFDTCICKCKLQCSIYSILQTCYSANQYLHFYVYISAFLQICFFSNLQICFSAYLLWYKSNFLIFFFSFCKSAFLQICLFENLLFCKSAFLLFCKSAFLQICLSANLLFCKSAFLIQTSKSAFLHISLSAWLSIMHYGVPFVSKCNFWCYDLFHGFFFLWFMILYSWFCLKSPEIL